MGGYWAGYDKTLGILINPAGYFPDMDAQNRKLYKYEASGSNIIEKGSTDLLDTSKLDMSFQKFGIGVTATNHCFSIDLEYGSCLYQWVTGRAYNHLIFLSESNFKSLKIDDKHTAFLLNKDRNLELYIVSRN